MPCLPLAYPRPEGPFRARAPSSPCSPLPRSPSPDAAPMRTPPRPRRRTRSRWRRVTGTLNDVTVTGEHGAAPTVAVRAAARRGPDAVPDPRRGRGRRAPSRATPSSSTSCSSTAAPARSTARPGACPTAPSIVVDRPAAPRRAHRACSARRTAAASPSSPCAPDDGYGLQQQRPARGRGARRHDRVRRRRGRGPPTLAGRGHAVAPVAGLPTVTLERQGRAHHHGARRRAARRARGPAAHRGHGPRDRVGPDDHRPLHGVIWATGQEFDSSWGTSPTQLLDRHRTSRRLGQGPRRPDDRLADPARGAARRRATAPRVPRAPGSARRTRSCSWSTSSRPASRLARRRPCPDSAPLPAPRPWRRRWPPSPCSCPRSGTQPQPHQPQPRRAAPVPTVRTAGYLTMDDGTQLAYTVVRPGRRRVATRRCSSTSGYFPGRDPDAAYIRALRRARRATTRTSA